MKGEGSRVKGDGHHGGLREREGGRAMRRSWRGSGRKIGGCVEEESWGGKY